MLQGCCGSAKHKEAKGLVGLEQGISRHGSEGTLAKEMSKRCEGLVDGKEAKAATSNPRHFQGLHFQSGCFALSVEHGSALKGTI